MNCRAAALFLSSCFAVLASPLPVTLAQENTRTVVLELGKPVDRELAGGQSDKYTLPVAANQYVRVLARQNGVDLVLTFRDSTGRKLVDEHDHFGGISGVETFALITTEAGNCTVEVGTVQKTAAPGRYSIELADFRSPTDKDRLNAEAETQYRAANVAFFKKTAAGYAEAIEKFSPSRFTFDDIIPDNC